MNPEKELYQPSPEEIENAENAMTNAQRKATRKREKTFVRPEDKNEFFPKEGYEWRTINGTRAKVFGFVKYSSPMSGKTSDTHYYVGAIQTDKGDWLTAYWDVYGNFSSGDEGDGYGLSLEEKIRKLGQEEIEPPSPYYYQVEKWASNNSDQDGGQKRKRS